MFPLNPSRHATPTQRRPNTVPAAPPTQFRREQLYFPVLLLYIIYFYSSSLYFFYRLVILLLFVAFFITDAFICYDLPTRTILLGGAYIFLLCCVPECASWCGWVRVVRPSFRGRLKHVSCVTPPAGMWCGSRCVGGAGPGPCSFPALLTPSGLVTPGRGFACVVRAEPSSGTRD